MAFGFSGRPSGQLPGEVTSFVGRESELADVLRTLEQSRLVTLTGPGGVGKTRLALHSARTAGEGFADGVRLVELSGLKDPELLPHTLASALELPEQNTRPQIDAVVEYLARRELLLILDTCEHVLDACALLADLLLPEAPGLTLMATSRQPLDVPGEHVLSVPPLPLPPEEDAAGGQEGATAGGDALALFADRAAAVVPGFTLTPANRGPALTLCRRLDGIPLAIELATVRLRALPLEELVQRLGDTFALLAGGRLTTLSRHQTLRTTIGWSHELCTASERLLWARLSVFSGTFDLAAAERVCTDDRLPAGEVVRLLIGLVDKSVVLRVENEEGGARYRLLDTIREYGAEWLKSIGGTAACRRRLIEHCHNRLRHFEEHFATDEQLPLFRALAADRDNLRAAVEYALEEAASRALPAPVSRGTHDGGPGTALPADPYQHTSPPLALTASMWTYWACGGLLAEARYWMDKAIAAPSPSSPGSATDRAKTLTWYGLFCIMAGSHETSLEPLREAHAIARRLGDPLLTAWAVGFEGSALNYRGEHERALAMTDDAVAIMRSTGDQLTFLMACYAKGFAYALAGRPDEAVTACEEGLRLLGTSSEERWNQGYLYLVKGFAHILRGEREECAAAALRAVRLKGDLGDVIGVAYCLSLLAWVASAQGRHRRAAVLLGATTEQWRISGDSSYGGITSLQFLSEAVSSDVCGALGQERYDRAFRQGGQLSLEQAVLFAVGDADSLSTLPRQPGDSSKGSAAAEHGEGTGALTRREREVAELVAEGLSNREIAERLVVSKRTADAHIEHILAKLGFSSRAQITALLGKEATGPASPRTEPDARRT
ncbi:ATP-binding protein [Streptomyces iconiensis]|uniref:LuxR C-terminal-related transcriptional regulator n=1 Tax=Streptomyces iconiensis TaxID=1384038 RepID=A0ABT6ZU46_9ACTN|nr:LuxR C-terminal-related transcriptional regulator [Streptomyces iconiensis]MDJ1132578.1 LuxR C-terminal-related transcriptional regulator [Streptomyces iconiensis]